MVFCLSHAQGERDSCLTQGECVNGPRGTLSSRGRLVRWRMLVRSRSIGGVRFRRHLWYCLFVDIWTPLTD